ncbi:MAG: LptF/LptG family permease [Caldimicrobium sp.]
MKTFFIFLLKELFFHTFLFLLFFLVLLTLIMGTLNLRDVLEFNPSLLMILGFYILTSLQLLSFLLSLSSFNSVLFTLQRLKEERELLALFSLGYTIKDLIKPFLLFMIFIFLATLLSHVYLNPYAKRMMKEAQIKLAKAFFEKPIPSKTPVPLTNTFYLYVAESEKTDSSNIMKRVILLERKSSKERGIYLAKAATLDLEKGIFYLSDGIVFTHSNYKEINILKFKEYLFKISKEYLKKPDLYVKRGEMSFFELKKTIKALIPGSEKYYRYLSEYYQRIFYGFSIFPLLLQAFILGLVIKPQSRYLLLLMGLTFYLFFYFVYNFFVSLGESGKIYPLFSHIYFNGLLIFLLAVEFAFIRKRGISFS